MGQGAMYAAGHRPDLLIGLNYFIAAGYVIAAMNLLFALWIGLRRFIDAGDVPGVAVVVLWIGTALFLVGCGWHHVQHADHLRHHYELATSAAYWSAWLQSLGLIFAVGSAIIIVQRVTFAARVEAEAQRQYEGGVPGPAGPAGPTGKDGRQGDDGLQGRDGVEGIQGIEGHRGIEGKRGLEGRRGAPGPSSPDKGDR